MSNEKCKVRVPDHTDFWPCDKPVYAEGVCKAHFPEHMDALRAKRAEAQKAVDECDAAFARVEELKREPVSFVFGSADADGTFWRATRNPGEWVFERHKGSVRDMSPLYIADDVPSAHWVSVPVDLIRALAQIVKSA